VPTVPASCPRNRPQGKSLGPARFVAASAWDQRRSARIGRPATSRKCYPKLAHSEPCPISLGFIAINCVSARTRGAGVTLPTPAELATSLPKPYHKHASSPPPARVPSTARRNRCTYPACGTPPTFHWTGPPCGRRLGVPFFFNPPRPPHRGGLDHVSVPRRPLPARLPGPRPRPSDIRRAAGPHRLLRRPAAGRGCGSAGDGALPQCATGLFPHVLRRREDADRHRLGQHRPRVGRGQRAGSCAS
jgi:hypothetical protein